MSDIIKEAREALEGVTPGPWTHGGEPWNQIVWSGADNRVCFMAHSNGLDDNRDIATARFIAWAREGVPALIARAEAAENKNALLDVELHRIREAIKMKGGTEHSPTEDAYNAACAAIRKHKARAEAAEAALASAYMAGRDDAAKVIKATAHILASTGYEAFSNRINQIADGVLDLPVPADLAKRLGVGHE